MILARLITSDPYPKVHQCVHDEIDYPIHEQHVQYKNNPFRRNLLQAASYEPIRIRPYYDKHSINESILTATQISYIKSLVSASIQYLQSFLKVIPVDGPLFVDRCPKSERALHGGFVFPFCSDSTYSALEPKSCGRAIIPRQHLAESWSSNIFGYSRLYAPGGTGIADTDLIIYVTYNSEHCSNQTLAYALPCSVDQIGRPIAGNVNFCPRVIHDENYWKFDAMVTLHELTHVLVFAPTLWDKFYDWDSKTIITFEDVVLETGNVSDGYNWIITPKVRQIAQEYFDCAALPGAPLENYGLEGTVNSHWEAKYMQYEYMNGMILSAHLYVSAFTLGLMDDSGWYEVDYNYAEEFTWGLGEGCEFFTQECIDNKTGISNYPQYFCESNSDNGCSFDYTSIAYCLMYNYSNEGIPDKFRYYTDADMGGTEMHDYCGLRNPVDHQYGSNHSDFEPICWDERGNTYFQTSTYLSSHFGIDARCVDITNINGTKAGHCFTHKCIDYDAINNIYNAVSIEINVTVSNSSQIITCYRNQSSMSVNVSVAFGRNFIINCPNIDAVCGTSLKPFECFWGYYNNDLRQCVCSVGYIGEKCNIKNINVSASTAQIAATHSPTTATISRFCIHWLPVIHAMFQGEYIFDGLYEAYPAYIHHVNDNISTFLYFSRADSRWQLTKNKDRFEQSNYDYTGYCEQYGVGGVALIETCENWYFFDGVGFVKEKIVYDPSCYFWETINPTTNPNQTTTALPISSATISVTIAGDVVFTDPTETAVGIANIQTLSIVKILSVLSIYLSLIYNF